MVVDMKSAGLERLTSSHHRSITETNIGGSDSAIGTAMKQPIGDGGDERNKTKDDNDPFGRSDASLAHTLFHSRESRLGQASKYTFIIGFWIYVFIVLFGEWLFLPSGFNGFCESLSSTFHYSEKEYLNPDYDQNPCRFVRTYHLLYITVEECDLSRRLLASVVFGGIIGWERRSRDRPAGIRTMSLVSLGACFFTICSMLAFKSSTMEWDSSRVTAAIPSGVGFLGGGLIWKGTVSGGGPEMEEIHQVHGLTTAASLWLAASVGVGAGGGMYFTAMYSVVLLIFILRFGPTLIEEIEIEEEEEDDENHLKEDDYDGSIIYRGDTHADDVTVTTAGGNNNATNVATYHGLSPKSRRSTAMGRHGVVQVVDDSYNSHYDDTRTEHSRRSIRTIKSLASKRHMIPTYGS